ncbi:hypothetical protein F8M41_026081 [Gigaspora margarita]|uniref:Uncharacterized protein n=1 Tax=Gigaspora margarita TaxID=4874 RepID=A0A8H3XJB5_GIGMA|nr:hypothetical protein F8M41_026081 [Gigaspora margarita]
MRYCLHIQESQDHIYNDLKISDLPRLSEADNSKELPNSSLLNRNDTKNGTQTPSHQITRNTFFAQFTASETHESIFKAFSENLTGLDDVKYFKEFISLFEEYKEHEKNNVYS